MSSSLNLPFSTEEFYGVFGRYNLAVWPAQVLLLLMALACIAALSFLPSLARRIPLVLAALWAWMGVAYHFTFVAAAIVVPALVSNTPSKGEVSCRPSNLSQS